MKNWKIRGFQLVLLFLIAAIIMKKYLGDLSDVIEVLSVVTLALSIIIMEAKIK